MKWTKHWRMDGRLEWVCECGVGHPDIRMARNLANRYGDKIETWLIHGCCGCCSRDDFPGRDKNGG